MKHFEAITVFLRHPFSWTLYGFAAVLLGMIPILGWLMLGAMIAGAVQAVREDRAPRVSDMFDGTGILGMALFGGGQIAASFLPFGQLIVWFLFWFSPEFSSKLHRLGPVDAMRASYRAMTRGAFGGVILFIVSGMVFEILVVAVVFALCLSPLAFIAAGEAATIAALIGTGLAVFIVLVPLGSCIWLIAYALEHESSRGILEDVAAEIRAEKPFEYAQTPSFEGGYADVPDVHYQNEYAARPTGRVQHARQPWG